MYFLLTCYWAKDIPVQRIDVCWHFVASSCVTTFATFSLIHFLFFIQCNKLSNCYKYTLYIRPKGVDSIWNMIRNAFYSLCRCSIQHIEIVSDWFMEIAKRFSLALSRCCVEISVCELKTNWIEKVTKAFAFKQSLDYSGKTTSFAFWIVERLSEFNVSRTAASTQ